MSDKILNTRVKQKIDTKANWGKAVNFVPLKGEIIVYSDLNRIKVGDGAKKVGELPFLADNDTHQSIKTLNTNNTAAQTPSSSEAIAGSGTINLHKVAKTGSYNDLNNKPTIPTVPKNIVKYTEATAEVAGTKKTVASLSPSALYVANGLIMGGTAAAAGLVTRGICGVMTPDSTGACTKENLYLNYDGDNNYSRKVVLGAGSPGNSIAGGATTFSAVRGDQMVGYVNSLALIKSGKQTTTSTADGGSNVYTFTDTKGATSTFTVKNGSKGSTGPQGPQGPVGPNGAAAGFGTPTASVDANVGTPSVTVTADGPNTAKVFNFAFKNLKGQKGDTGATGSVADLTVSGTGNAIANISLDKSTKKITATKGNFIPMAGTGTTPITSDLYMKGRYDRTISSSGLVPEGGGSVGSKPAYSDAYYGLKGICYSYYSDDSTYGATNDASSTTNYQGFCYNPLGGTSQRYNLFQLYTPPGLSVYRWISQNGKGPNYNSMDWSSFRCSTIDSDGLLKYYDGSSTYTKTIKDLMEKMEISPIDGSGYATYGYVKDEATGLMICYGTTGSRNGAGVSVTFSATFKGAPTVVVVPYVKSLKETSIVSQYRNAITIRCYINSNNSNVDSPSGSTSITGFILDTGNGEYQYFNYIAIGQYK